MMKLTAEERARRATDKEVDDEMALGNFGFAMTARALPGQTELVFRWRGRRYVIFWRFIVSPFGQGMHWSHPVLATRAHLFLVEPREQPDENLRD
jgi:hypothetical protein